MDVKQGSEDAPMRSFSHIVIGQDDTDEVIQAGIVDEPLAEEPQVDSLIESAPEQSPVQPESEQPREQPVAETPVSTQAPARDDGYHETTLEDLNGSPMPFAQKAVLIAAALLVIVAVAYWFLR